MSGHERSSAVPCLIPPLRARPRQPIRCLARSNGSMANADIVLILAPGVYAEVWGRAATHGPSASRRLLRWPTEAEINPRIGAASVHRRSNPRYAARPGDSLALVPRRKRPGLRSPESAPVDELPDMIATHAHPFPTESSRRAAKQTDRLVANSSLVATRPHGRDELYCGARPSTSSASHSSISGQSIAHVPKSAMCR